jgi:uncharacterized iron-regulated membrane protein
MPLSLPTRSTWLKIHLYLALICGFFFALLGLSGSVSVYREELDGLLNPRLVIDQPQGKYQSLDKIMAAVKSAHPQRYGSWTLEMPQSPHSMMTAWYEKPRETYFELYAPLMVSVNPYTAEVVASRFWGQTLTTWIADLHTQLQLGSIGWQAVGALGLILMVSIGTGLTLWWPGWRGVGQALKINFTAGVMQLNFDSHRLLGLLAAPALLLLTSTGILLSYPGVLESLAGAPGMAHGETGREIVSTATPNNHPTSLEAAEFVARGSFPRSVLRRVTTPAGDTGIYRINLRQPGEINQRHPFTTVWIDRWSGQTREVRNPSSFTSGQTLATWIWPLHTGEALGPKGRFAWFIAGQSLFLLYVTGMVRWLYRIGKINDRPIDFSALKPIASRLISNVSSRLSSYAVMLARRLQPRLSTAYQALRQWLIQYQAKLADRQKRNAKSDWDL